MMKKLLKFEFRKLFKTKSFFVCLIICIGFVLLSGITTKFLLENSKEEMITPSGLSMLKSVISSANIILVGGIFTALFVCEDSVLGTDKNIYAKGYTRTKVFLSKYIVSLCAIIIFTMLSMIIAYLFGQITWNEKISCNNQFILSIIGQILMVVAYHALFFIVSTKVGKVGGSITFNIVCPLLIGMILNMADTFLKAKNIKLSSYWIDSLLTTLQQSEIIMNNITISLIMGFVYIFLFLGIGIFFNKKKEIK